MHEARCEVWVMAAACTRGGTRGAPKRSWALVGPWSGMDTGLDTGEAVEWGYALGLAVWPRR